MIDDREVRESDVVRLMFDDDEVSKRLYLVVKRYDEKVLLMRLQDNAFGKAGETSLFSASWFAKVDMKP